MSKPIALLKVSVKLPLGKNGRQLSAGELTGLFTKLLEDKLKDDYHCFVLPSLKIDDFELQVFRTEDSEELDVEKLKEEVRQFIKTQSNETNSTTSN